MSTVLSLLLTLLLFDVMVIIHEGGHLFVARALGIPATEFSVGMGPCILSKELKSGLRLSLRALPFGGFVAFGDAAHDYFWEQKHWKKILTLLAGPVMNLVLGFLSMVLLVSVTMPATNIVGGFRENAVSCDYGLREGDAIVKVNRASTHTGYDVNYEIFNQGYAPLDLTVKRDGKTVVLEDVVFATETEDGITFGVNDLKMYAATESFGTVISQSFWRSVSSVKMVYDSLWSLITGRYGLEAMSGVVGVADTVKQAVSYGFEEVLYLFSLLTVNLGVMNLLPIPALDGGQILFSLIELISRRRMKKETVEKINRIFLSLLLAFAILITVKDVFKLFG